jgi:hypothetical protein
MPLKQAAIRALPLGFIRFMMTPDLSRLPASAKRQTASGREVAGVAFSVLLA